MGCDNLLQGSREQVIQANSKEKHRIVQSKKLAIFRTPLTFQCGGRIPKVGRGKHEVMATNAEHNVSP